LLEVNQPFIFVIGVAVIAKPIASGALAQAGFIESMAV
jgi:hypothetical protein